MKQEKHIAPCGTKNCYCHGTEFDGHCAAEDKPRMIDCPDYTPDPTESMYEIYDCITAEEK